MREFDASAHRKLARRQARLRKEYDAIKTVELEQQRLANLTALDHWCPDAGLLVECLQVLSRVYAELDSLCEPKSRYAELVSVFGRWSTSVEASWANADKDFVEALPEGWRAAHTSLSLRMRSLQHDMGVLPRVPVHVSNGHSPTLEIVMRSCNSLLDGMLRELETMSELEREVLSQERSRIDEGVKAVTAASLEGKKSAWVPAWQSVA